MLEFPHWVWSLGNRLWEMLGKWSIGSEILKDAGLFPHILFIGHHIMGNREMFCVMEPHDSGKTTRDTNERRGPRGTCSQVVQWTRTYLRPWDLCFQHNFQTAGVDETFRFMLKKHLIPFITISSTFECVAWSESAPNIPWKIQSSNFQHTEEFLPPPYADDLTKQNKHKK